LLFLFAWITLNVINQRVLSPWLITKSWLDCVLWISLGQSLSGVVIKWAINKISAFILDVVKLLSEWRCEQILIIITILVCRFLMLRVVVSVYYFHIDLLKIIHIILLNSIFLLIHYTALYWQVRLNIWKRVVFLILNNFLFSLEQLDHFCSWFLIYWALWIILTLLGFFHFDILIKIVFKISWKIFKLILKIFKWLHILFSIIASLYILIIVFIFPEIDIIIIHIGHFIIWLWIL
jgi:hypothetical protein